MSARGSTPDLTGSDESLEDLIARLKAQLRRPKARPRRDPPPDDGEFVTSRRPRGGAGGAEAPLPEPEAEAGLADCCGY